jgi:hypothetical protein
MHPKAEREKAGGDERNDDETVGNERRAAHRGDDHRDHARSRQKDDVNLGVAEEPEQVLPQQRVSALGGDEKRPAKGALELQHDGGEDHRGKREHDHGGEHQHGPREHRHLVERHAGGTRAQHADDDLNGAGDGRYLDEADAEQPEVSADIGRIARAGERRIHEPAARRREVEEQRAEENQSADKIGPERIGAEARKRQVAGAEHLRQQ